ncbi:MAG: outer membrane lipoprotein-sorting protein [Syntrophobacterales bacterium]|nr:outer membrane lipoprotein-sorting protein [Syntrophobacterales bacterium]
MKARFFLTIFLVLFLVQPLFALTGRDVMEKNDALPESKTAVSSVLMQIHKGGRVMEKEFESRTKKFKDNEDKTLISFIKPTKIKLLTHTHRGKDDDQWLRLSSGKIKRIAASDKGKPFVNSHFYYDDISSRNIDDYTYLLLDDGEAAGSDCYRVEAIRQNGTKVYSKLILYVRKSDYFIVRIDFYRKDKFHKYLENHDIRTVKDILTPFSTIMTLANEKGKTELRIEKLEYNRNLRNSTFNKEALR